MTRFLSWTAAALIAMGVSVPAANAAPFSPSSVPTVKAEQFEQAATTKKKPAKKQRKRKPAAPKPTAN